MNIRFYHMPLLKSHFGHKNIKILPSFMQRYNGRHYVTFRNLYTTSGLSILLHGAISLPDATSCDKMIEIHSLSFINV